MEVFRWITEQLSGSSLGNKDNTGKKSHKPAPMTIEVLYSDLQRTKHYWWDKLQNNVATETPPSEVDATEIIKGIEDRINSHKFKLIDIPSNIQKIMELVRTKKYDYLILEEHLKCSPVMTGEILKVANSALFTGKQPVHKLTDAFPRIGEERLISILYIGLSRSFVLSHQDKLIPIAENMVAHSHAVANIASVLAQPYGLNGEIAYVAGLLHDIGKIALLCDISESTEIIDLYDYIDEDSFSRILTPLHESVGVLIAKKWNLSEEIMTVIGNHHNLFFSESNSEKNSSKLSALINLSDTLAHILGIGKPITGVNLFDLESAQILGIKETEEHIDHLYQVPSLFENFKELLNED